MGEIPRFITGVPEESLKIPTEITDYKQSINNINVLSLAGTGDASNSGSFTYNKKFSKTLIQKISLSYSMTIDNFEKSFDVVVEMSVRGLVFFTDSFSYASGLDFNLEQDVNRNFDLINPIELFEDDVLTATCHIKNKKNTTNDATLSVSIDFVGQRQK